MTHHNVSKLQKLKNWKFVKKAVCQDQTHYNENDYPSVFCHSRTFNKTELRGFDAKPSSKTNKTITTDK